jgi:G6PDH family F420-dependent oxidoreductase
VEIGYWLSSEEHPPNDLVCFAQRAEEVGFSFAVISDHFHPWLDQQGHSPFVWSVIGGIAQVTRRLTIGTGVTCPMIRTHPAIIAHAAATAACMLPGRFFLGVGSGENLNEHILGTHWPPPDVRLDMLEEALAVMRLLWQGGSRSHHGPYYTVEDANIYTRPEHPPPVIVAASGTRAGKLAGRVGDGLIAVAPNRKLVEAFAQSGGSGKPRYGQVKVCWAADEAQARRTAHTIWPNGALPGPLTTELREPDQFEAACELVTEDQVAERIVCGPDPERHVAAIRAFVDAGFEHVSVHQVGPDQDGFFTFYQREVLPRLGH